MRAATILIGVVCFALPTWAVAKPKIAVAPIKGDTGDKVAKAIVEALTGDDFEVVGPHEAGKAMKKLDISDDPDAKEIKQLETKLDVAGVVIGKLDKDGSKRSLHLEIHVHGKRASGFTVEFKSATSKGFRKNVHDEVVKKVGDPDDDPDEADAKQAKKSSDEDDAARAKKQADDDDSRRAKKQADDDDAKRAKSDADRKRSSDDDDSRRAKKRTADADGDRKRSSDDDETSVRKHKRHKHDDRSAVSPNVRVGAGAAFGQRHLSYDTRASFAQAPPTLSTAAASARIEGEIYPFALSDSNGAAARFGIAGAYDKTLGLSIPIPNMPLSAPINQSHYAIGVRYRIDVSESSVLALGLDYAHRRSVADRSGLLTPNQLDAPDVEYSAIAPVVAIRIPATPSIVGFGVADGLLILSTGPIQRLDSYGSSTVFGVELSGGVDIAFTRQIGLRIAVEFSLINLSFKGKGDMSNARDGDSATVDVTGATDRSIGAAATLGVTF